MFKVKLPHAAIVGLLMLAVASGVIFLYVGDRGDPADPGIDISELPPTAAGTTETWYPYLDDLVLAPDATGAGESLPKLMLTETQSMEGTVEQFTKYDLIGIKAGMLYKTEKIQQLVPEVEVHYGYSPRDYQGETLRDPCNLSKGIPFGWSGPATEGCEIWSGHWLYAAGTQLAQGVSGSAMTLYVDDAKRLKPGRWVVIYDAPAGSFKNAEHARIASINTDVHPHRVNLETRGLKSTPSWHPAGSIVAMHVMGRGFTDQNWAFNTSLTCPRDANGNTALDVMVEWLGNSITKKGNGQESTTRIDGIYFDVDRYFIQKDKIDVDNDLVVDEGISPDGVNLLGEGLEQFYAGVRAKYPHLRIVGGDRLTRGFGTLDGIQMESFPVVSGESSDHSLATYGHDKGYDQFDGNLQRYFFNLNRGTDLGYTENLSKARTRLYYYKDRGGVPAPDNSAFRLAFGSTLLGNGHFGQQNSKTDPDPWYDEYAVDVTPGSATYGHAIASNPNDESLIRAHKRWLGQPLESPYRLYNPRTFAPGMTLLTNGGFESGTDGWRINNLNARTITTDKLEGKSALYVSGHTTYKADQWAATVQGAAVKLEAGKEYTLVFAAKASQIREVEVQVNSSLSVFLVPTEWTRYVHTFKVTSSGTYRPQFRLGREDTEVWLDAIYLFEGNANVFVREFENGIVVVNATPSQHTLQLPQPFLRIKGTGQDAINDGSNVSMITLPAYDAAILVRPEELVVEAAPVVEEATVIEEEPIVEEAPVVEEEPIVEEETVVEEVPTTVVSGSGNSGVTEACARPEFSADDAAAVLVWEDTCDPGRWHLEVRSNVGWSAFEGRLSAKFGLKSAEGVMLEDHDVFSPNGTDAVDFVLKVGGAGVDGIDFVPAPGYEVCLSVSGPEGTKVRLGTEGRVVPSTVNLLTGGACGENVALGEPDYAQVSGPATFLWKVSSDTEMWHMVVKGSDTAGELATFEGSVVTGRALADLQPWKLESHDVLIKSSKGLEFKMLVWGSAVDGALFKVASGDQACFAVNPVAGQSVYLGPSMIPVSAPLDLVTLGYCNP
jgi:hypothetical protein